MSLFYIEKPEVKEYEDPKDRILECMTKWEQIVDYSFKIKDPGDYEFLWSVDVKGDAGICISINTVDICRFDDPGGNLWSDMDKCTAKWHKKCRYSGGKWIPYSGFKLENLDNNMEHHIFVNIVGGMIKNLRVKCQLIGRGHSGCIDDKISSNKFEPTWIAEIIRD